MIRPFDKLRVTRLAVLCIAMTSMELLYAHAPLTPSGHTLSGHTAGRMTRMGLCCARHAEYSLNDRNGAADNRVSKSRFDD